MDSGIIESLLFIMVGMGGLGCFFGGIIMLFSEKTRKLGALLLALPLGLGILSGLFLNMLVKEDAPSKNPSYYAEDFLGATSSYGAVPTAPVPSDEPLVSTEAIDDNTEERTEARLGQDPAIDVDDGEASEFADSSLEENIDEEQPAYPPYNSSIDGTSGVITRIGWGIPLALVLILIGVGVASIGRKRSAPREGRWIGKALLAGGAVLGFLILMPSQMIKEPSPTLSTSEKSVAQVGPRTPAQPAAGTAETEERSADPSAPASAERPEWIERAPYQSGHAYYVPVSSGLFEQDDACKEALAIKIEAVVLEQIAAITGPMDSLASEKILDSMTISDLTFDYYKEAQILNVGPLNDVEMKEQFSLLEFDYAFRSHVESQWWAIVSKERLRLTGLLCAGFLCLLVIGYGYLRIDTATEGKYSGHLKLASAAFILVVLLSGMALIA